MRRKNNEQSYTDISKQMHGNFYKVVYVVFTPRQKKADDKKAGHTYC